jgi:hypothetical protein
MRAEFKWLKMEAEWHTDWYTSISFPFFISKVDVSAYRRKSLQEARNSAPTPNS